MKLDGSLTPAVPRWTRDNGEGEDYEEYSGGWKKKTARRSGRRGSGWGANLPISGRKGRAATRAAVSKGTPQPSTWEAAAVDSSPSQRSPCAAQTTSPAITIHRRALIKARFMYPSQVPSPIPWLVAPVNFLSRSCDLCSTLAGAG